ncbi:phospholipase D-like domain-containing protein [Cohnella sp.]|uniref:phospholipase D-like domain-containing protein n=1 Tax=Cohnella sp. TaxID=1883426 RepID=UPI00356B2D25
MAWIAGLWIVNTALLLIIAVREVRRPAKALTWMTVGLVFPMIGFVCYLFVTNPVQMRRDKLVSSHQNPIVLPPLCGHSAAVIARSLQPLSVSSLRTGSVQILTNGMETYGRLLQSIQSAQKTIELEYYIYRNDHIGNRITDALIDRALSGVNIRFIRDGLGSRSFPKHAIRRMKEAGIECRTIFPLRFPWILSNLTYRDHCKIVIIDGKETFMGGINVGDEYTGMKPNTGFWRDTHMRITGESANDAKAVFEAHWKLASPDIPHTPITARNNPESVQRSHPNNEYPFPFGKTERSAFGWEWGSELGTTESTRIAKASSPEDTPSVYIQMFEGNPSLPTPVIREMHFICLTQATRSIDIVNPYFIPDADILMAIKTAAARGVRVRLLVPQRVIPKVAGAASRTYYGELVEAGVHVFQYNKGVLHAKVMIIDGEIAELGSSNYDLRSFRLNYEICAVMYHSDVARELTEQFERDLAEATPYRLEDHVNRPSSERMLDQAARLLSPLL